MDKDSLCDFQGNLISPTSLPLEKVSKEIGTVIMAEGDPLEAEVQQKNKLNPVWIISGALIGGSIGLGFAFFLHASIPVWLAFTGIGLVAGLGLGFRFTRRELKHRFVGEGGIEEHTYSNSLSGKSQIRTFVFQPNLHLYISESVEEKKHVGEVGEFSFRWRDGQSNSFRILGNYLTKHATAGREVGHPWAKAAAKSWTNWLISQTQVWKKSEKGIEFVVLGDCLIYLLEDRVKITKMGGEEPEIFPIDTVKRIQLTPTHIRILQNGGPLEYPLDKFSDLDYFLWLVKDWYKWDVTQVKK